MTARKWSGHTDLDARELDEESDDSGFGPWEGTRSLDVLLPLVRICQGVLEDLARLAGSEEAASNDKDDVTSEIGIGGSV